MKNKVAFSDGSNITWKKTLKNPGMYIVFIWCIFTFLVVGWIIFASFATTRNIFSGNLLLRGVTAKYAEKHPETLKLFGSYYSLTFKPINYYNAIVSHNVGKYFLNSMIYTFVSIFGIILVSAPAAYVLSRFKFRGNKTISNLFVAALGIPAIMIILPLFSLFTTLKLVNSRALLIILYICISVPFTVFFLTTFFKNLSYTFEEAASIDGCSPIKTFWVIMFPLAQPGIITVSIFNFITIWNEYFMALIFANSTNLRPVAVGLYAMIQSMKYIGDWAGMFAAVVIVFLPTFLLYIFLSEKIISGVTGGAIKG